MPTYDYRCERTGEMFEIWQSFSDEPLTSCPRAHGSDDNGGETCGAPVKKVFSKVGIAFKGDGFYKNDHGSNASGQKSEGSSRSESSSDSRSESSSSSSGTTSASSSAASGSD